MNVVRRLGAYLNDAVLPFYVLHETVVVTIAYFILAWELAPGVQFLLISTASLVVTLLLYDFGVRRSPVTRLLLGLKPVRRTDSSPSTLAADQQVRAPAQRLTGRLGT